MQAISYGPTKHYLSVFGYDAVHSSVSSVLSLVARVVQSQGYELQANLQSLVESVRDNLNHYGEVPTFIVHEYMLQFLADVQKAALTFKIR